MRKSATDRDKRAGFVVDQCYQPLCVQGYAFLGYILSTRFLGETARHLHEASFLDASRSPQMIGWQRRAVDRSGSILA